MAKRGGKVGATVLLLAGLWLGLAGSRWALALTAASSAGALKRLHAGALKLKASSNEDVERKATEAEWLQQTADQIKNFTVEQVREWAKAVLKAKNLDEARAAAAAQRLEEEDVIGELLIGVTPQELASAYNMKRGPANLLVNQLRASGGGAPPTAASGFQDDPEATEFIRELANA
ncbi:hypothetical protein AK812_SmicGene5192, partial [Symbiodinium microadriaticum]